MDPATGDTTCVWKAPAKEELEGLFSKAGVEVREIRAVQEVTASDIK